MPTGQLSNQQQLVAVVNPVSQAAGNADTSWIDMASWERLQAILLTGVLGASATVDFSVRQATDNAGAGAKALSPAKSITQMVKASDDNKQAIIEVKASDLDLANSFRYVSFRTTVGTAASLIAVAVLGDPEVKAPTKISTVNQIVT